MWLCVDGKFRPQHNPRALRTGRSKHNVYIELVRRHDVGLLNEQDLAEYENLGAELANLRADELLRLIVDPREVGSVIYSLRP